MTLSNIIETAIVPIVQLKRNWDEGWRTAPNIYVCRWKNSLAPNLSRAVMEWDYGVHKHPSDYSLQNYDPKDNLIDQFVRLVIPSVSPIEDESAGQENHQVVWSGRIADVADIRGAADTRGNGTGQQEIVAFGLANELRRAYVDGSYILRTGSARFIDRRLPFNFRTADSAITRGNRSADKIDGTYIFSDASDAKHWTARDVLEYLLKKFAPSSPEFTLEPATANTASESKSESETSSDPNELQNLSQMIDSWPASSTVAQYLNKIVKRQRAHGWSVNSDAQVIIRCTLAKPVETAGVTLMPNSNVIDIDCESSDVPGQPKVEIRESSDHRYSRIQVLGQHLWLCGTPDTGKIIPAWSNTIATEYIAATDDARDNPYFADVYQAFEVDLSNGKPFHGDQGVPVIDTNGDVKFDEGEGTTTEGLFITGRTLSRTTPLRTGATYNTDDGEKIKDTSSTELQPMRVYTKIADKYFDLSTIAKHIKNVSGVSNCSVSPLAGKCGFRIHAPYNHYLGKNHFTGTSVWQSPIDYDDLVATVAMRTDNRLCVSKNIPDQLGSGTPRTLLLEVADADCWILLKDTVVGTDGTQLLRAKKNIVLRNDAERLKIIAALAVAWYGQPRNAVTIDFANMEYDYELGSLVEDIVAGGRRTTVNTIISEISMDYTAENYGTTIKTAFAELDVVKTAGGTAGSASGMGFADATPTHAENVATQTHQPANLAPNSPEAPEVPPDGLPGMVNTLVNTGGILQAVFDYPTLIDPEI